MKTSIFLLLVLSCGAVAGLAQGLAILVLVEPYLDFVIGIENQSLFASGAAQDDEAFRASFEESRMIQKSGMIVGSVILGVSFGALFGFIYSAMYGVLPGRNGLQKSMVLAGVMWAVLYMSAFFKYPPNPPATGDTDTLPVRILLIFALVVILGLGTIGFHRLYLKLPHKRYAILAGYAAFVAAVVVLMPAGPGEPADLPNIEWYRAMTAVSATIFWAVMGLMLGSLWDKYVAPSGLPKVG